MARFFNTAGPCRPDLHYMLPPERRLPGFRRLIDHQTYFVVHAPRQTGKTTCFRALAQALTAEGSYAALLTSCEVGQAAGGDVERGVAAVLDVLRISAENHLPDPLLPPKADPATPAESRLLDLLTRWSRQCPRPVVLFLDEIDALVDDVLISVLRQLRTGYGDRPRSFPQTVALIGLRDVRDYRLKVRPEVQSLGTSSPFNIKVESLTLANFTEDEVAELYGQHTADTGQPFTPEASSRAFELTRGQPWLVNALARQAVEVLVPDRAVPVDAAVIESAKERLIQRQDTHLDSLIERLREPRVQRVIEPLLAGDPLSAGLLADDLRFTIDLGLVVTTPQGLEVANPMYREVIPRALSSLLEQTLPLPRPTYVAPDGGLRFDLLLEDFRAFWCENAEPYLAQAPYSEAAAQLVFMAFLQKVVNGGGFIDREYAVGSGRIDLCIRWPRPGRIERWAIELKVWRDGRPDPVPQGLKQLGSYLERLGLEHGTLIVFDGRSVAKPLPERCSIEEVIAEGKRIEVVRL
ncbi:MAG TPA: AAA family ATPase [Thermoanaerobaculia bacterium]|nr:AAA family ATPase [Thermoanaerobaculia bacterium]